jgi:hypothetical protein
VKTALKGKIFQNAEDINRIVTVALNAVPLEATADSFQKLSERINTRIEVCGDYFE